jgi:hypothetical protein
VDAVHAELEEHEVTVISGQPIVTGVCARLAEWDTERCVHGVECPRAQANVRNHVAQITRDP